MVKQTETENKLELAPIEVSQPPMVQESQTVGVQLAAEEKPLIPDEKITDYYELAIDCIKEDRVEAGSRYLELADMVINGGDPSSATKEAMVNCLKIKSDSVNQMIKILDLWTRLKMKEKVTGSQVALYQQNNKYEVGNGPNPHVRKLIKMAQEMESTND
jgi:hypothetical protein